MIIEFASSLHTKEFADASLVLDVIVTGTTNLGYVTGKGVVRVKSNTEALDYIGSGDRISKRLDGKFLHEGLWLVHNQ